MSVKNPNPAVYRNTREHGCTHQCRECDQYFDFRKPITRDDNQHASGCPNEYPSAGKISRLASTVRKGLTIVHTNGLFASFECALCHKIDAHEAGCKAQPALRALTALTELASTLLETGTRYRSDTCTIQARCPAAMPGPHAQRLSKASALFVGDDGTGAIHLTLYPGDKVRFDDERLRYTVMAANERFAVCTKPFNPKRTCLYTIIDFQRKVRGRENLIFCAGFESKELCEAALQRLETGETEVSYRHWQPLNIERVDRAVGERSAIDAVSP